MEFVDSDNPCSCSIESVCVQNRQELIRHGLIRDVRVKNCGVTVYSRRSQEYSKSINKNRRPISNCEDMRKFTSACLPLKSLPSTDSFRLLSLHAGAAGDILRGEITTSTLKSHPSYTALSHIWDDKSDLSPLATNKGYVVLSKDTAHALKAIRKQGGCTFIWVDELCINQKDAAEIASQMLHVGEIFKNAREIYLWQRQTIDSTFGTSPAFLQRCQPIYLELRNLLNHRSTRADPFLWYLPKSPSFYDWQSYNITHTAVPLLDEETFLQCQQALRNVLATSNDEEYKLLTDVLSGVLSSLRTLSLSEITRITILSKYINISNQPIDKATKFFAIQGQYNQARKVQLRQLLHTRWKSVLSLDMDEFVCPASAQMSVFLKWIQLPGIRKGHSYMAAVCLRELELSNAALQCIPTENSEFSNHCASLTDFSAYCLDCWQTHYKAAQTLDIHLSARLHSLLWPDIMTLKMSDGATHESMDSPCSVRCPDCLDWAIAYCRRRGFTVLGQAYERMKDSVTQIAVSQTIEKNSTASLLLTDALDRTLESLHLEKDSKTMTIDEKVPICLPSNHEYHNLVGNNATDNSWIWVPYHKNDSRHGTQGSTSSTLSSATNTIYDCQNPNTNTFDDWQMLNISSSEPENAEGDGPVSVAF